MLCFIPGAVLQFIHSWKLNQHFGMFVKVLNFRTLSCNTQGKCHFAFKIESLKDLRSDALLLNRMDSLR